jgi:phosphoglycerol transferase MdoB-like AlkP superfamily enzyme
VPVGYSPERVASVLLQYAPRDTVPTAAGSRGGVNLIVYVVESLMDPDDLGVRFTADPVPVLRALRRSHPSGFAIVPERFGGSANTEFEVLTGMTRAFLPKGSTSYRQHVRRRLPAFPSTLRRAGYATTAVQADPRYFYDRDRVYGLLGFESIVWLNGAPGVPWAPRGGWPPDSAVVDAVIRTSQGTRPFFTFAFPSSTHGPYDVGTYRGSPLGVLDPAVNDPTGEIKEYINALHDADRALGRLVDYFGRQPDSTIIAVLGDHLPPFTTPALRTFTETLDRASPAERERLTHRVPLVIWSNFSRPRESLELGTAALPSYLLHALNITPSGFLAVNDAVRRRVPVVASYTQTADGRSWDRDSLPAAERELITAYRLLQYDLLLGDQHGLRDPQPRVARSANTAARSGR